MRLLLFITLLWSACSLQAQVPDSLSAEEESFLTDTTKLLAPGVGLDLPPRKPAKGIRKFFQSNYPSPFKAALFSFIVPGLGQAYNKKFWKVPIVYTGVGSMVYLIGKNGQNYRRWRDAYRQRVDGDPTTIDEFVDLYPTDDRLKTIRDAYRKRREQSYIGLVAFLILSSADAFVDAHLMHFDVNDDLSFDIHPQVSPIGNSSLAPGIGISFNWGH